MPVRPRFNPDNFYFVTSTAVRHIHLFHEDLIKRIIVDSFHYLRVTPQTKLFIFVIMPNHIHIIAEFSQEHPLADIMLDFKKFTARQIYRHFQADQNTKVLDVLRREGEVVKQEYKVWEDNYDARDIFSTKFLQQKMDYIHQNPSQPHWKLAETPERYLWSTAGFYLEGRPCLIPSDDVREFLV